MRKAILVLLLGVSVCAHAANIQYDLSWVLTDRSGLAYLVVVGFAAMLVLRRRNGAVTLDRRRIA